MAAKKFIRKTAKLEGKVFGRLTVIERAGPNQWHQMDWKCSCTCGSAVIASTHDLNLGIVRSCGCLRLDTIRKHGKYKTSTYKSWCMARERCNNPNDYRYSRYGGRGIKICDRWQSFENFLADMGERPRGLSLDRINNDGNYEPGNCRWATADQQANNNSRTKFIVINGVEMSLNKAIKWIRANGKLRYEQ